MDDQIPRASQRTTLAYRFLPTLSLGIEHNPRSDESNLIGNWVAMTEKRLRPALIFGTSSDRIGTPEGQAYFATVSKDLGPVNGWPIAPYAGVSYGTFDDELRAIGGLRTRFGKGWSSTLIYDGEEVHPTVDFNFLGTHVLTGMWVATEEFGIAYSVTF